MEFSVSRSLQQFSDEYSVPFPNLTAQPFVDLVNPGVSQAVNLFETIVPLRGKAPHTLETQMEAAVNPEKKELSSSDQIGGGEKKMEPKILNSFMHPIKTDSIIFPEQKKPLHKPQKRKSEDSSKRPHKFQVV